LARYFGVSPKALLGDRVEFVWTDNAKFKQLTASEYLEKAALTSFAVAVGRVLVRATPHTRSLLGVHASEIRNAILAGSVHVGLQDLLATCWGVGIPVIHLRVFPLASKSMQAMVVGVDGRFAVLLGRDAHYPAPVAFALAHEMGHIAKGHVGASGVLVDDDTVMSASTVDAEETEANKFALEVLTGSADPDIRANVTSFNSAQLAQAVLQSAGSYRIEPGTLALCLAYRTNNWRVAMAALRRIYSEPKDVWREVNLVAESGLNWGSTNDEDRDFLAAVMGIADE
jgi:hypothetical protein